METSLPVSEHFHDPAFMLSLLVAVGVTLQWIAARLGIPSILLLLITGFIAGPVTGIFNPDALFGDLLFPGISMAVAIILFEGALTLRFADLRGAEQVVVRLITLGVAVTVFLVGWVTHKTLGLSLELAFLFGAIVSVSGPTVVIPMLRTIRPTERVARILRWEGILIDPIGAVLAVIIFQALLAGATLSQVDTLWDVGKSLGVGAICGMGAGVGLGIILKRHLLPEYLSNVFTLGAVLFVNAIANLLAHEAGLMAVTVMGMTLANMRGVPTERLLDFKESLSVLLISMLFIVLASRLELASLLAAGPALLIILFVVLFVVRPLAVLASTIGSETTWPERALLAWIAPRGIIAAAISALFALRLEAAGWEEAELLVGLTFAVIVATVVLQSLTAASFARFLGVAQPDAKGVLVVGGNLVARTIAAALQEAGVKILVVDSSWSQIRSARMMGLPTFFGNAVSEHADRKMDLMGIGVLMAMSRRPASNSLACIHFKSDFGGGNVYTIRLDQKNLDREVDSVSFEDRGHLLFKPEMTLEKIETLLGEGYKIKVTKLSDDFKFEDLFEKLGSTDPLLFGITAEGSIRAFSEETSVKAGKGWRIAYLTLPEKNSTSTEPDTDCIP